MPRQKRPQKQDIVSQLAEKLAKAEIVIVAEFKGINVADITALRNKCREQKLEIKVYKNRLTKLALAQANLPVPGSEVLTGQNLVVIGYDDPVAAAKVLAAFAKTNEKLVIKGGVYESKSVDTGVINQLSQMPSFPEIMGKILGGLKSPASQLVRNTKYPISYLTLTLKAIGEKGGADAA